MTRLPDWEARLSAYLQSVWDRPYTYGAHDCVLFSASVVEALTGHDPAAQWRGRYSTAIGSARTLTKAGFSSVVDAWTATLGELIAPALAQRGDIVLEGGATGVCMGSFALFVGQQGQHDGLVRVPRDAWQAAWKV